MPFPLIHPAFLLASLSAQAGGLPTQPCQTLKSSPLITPSYPGAQIPVGLSLMVCVGVAMVLELWCKAMGPLGYTVPRVGGVSPGEPWPVARVKVWVRGRADMGGRARLGAGKFTFQTCCIYCWPIAADIPSVCLAALSPPSHSFPAAGMLSLLTLDKSSALWRPFSGALPPAMQGPFVSLALPASWQALWLRLLGAVGQGDLRWPKPGRSTG
jgi:hypothetical protein